MTKTCLVMLVVACVATGAAVGQPTAGGTSAGSVNPVSPDQAMGRKFPLTMDDLPAPYVTPSVSNGPLKIPFKAQVPLVPEGFAAALVAKLEHPRRLLVLPDGDVVVAEQRLGVLTLLRLNAQGKAWSIERFAEGFDLPYGLAWRDGYVLVADQDGIWRVPHALGDLRTGHGPERTIEQPTPEARKPARQRNGREMITKSGVFGLVRGHMNRPLAIDPRTGALFVGVGSAGNIGIEPEVKATIQRFEPDGTGQSTYVSGTRNPCGLAINPDNGELWAVVQERDGLGDRLPPDYMIRAEQGAFYGWPYAYIGQHPQRGFANKAPEKVRASRLPDLLFEAHSSTLDLVFYNGTQFPSEYRGNVFVVLKGSWNRAEPTGYKVVRVPFADGRPEGFYENFVTGFWVSGHGRAQVWGRPAAIAVAKDGSLLIADDTAGTIWRVSYAVPQRRAASADVR
jgi:glucose/arabinose dehydrogenase